MTKKTASELDAIHKRKWDIEHLSDDDYCAKYQPSGAPIRWLLWALGILFFAAFSFGI